MKRTRTITAIIVGLGFAAFAGEALAGPAGPRPGWTRGQGRSYGPGWWRGMASRLQMNADPNSAQPGNSWRPGPFCPFAQDPNENMQGWQGRGPGVFGRGFQGPRGPYCPFGQGPNQNLPGWQGRGPGRFGQGFQGRGPGASGWGFGRRNMMMQRGPVAGRAGRGPAFQGRAGRGLQRRYMAPRGWGMNGGRGQFGPRGRGWAPGWGPCWRQGWNPNLNPNLQSEKTPDANAPAESPPKDQA
jgi:hypothetical protein